MTRVPDRKGISFALVLVVTVAMLAGGCPLFSLFKPEVEQAKTGTLVARAAIPEELRPQGTENQGLSAVTKMTFVVSQGTTRHSQTKQLAVSDSSVEATFGDLAPGTWTVTVTAEDADGYAVAVGSSTGEVSSGALAEVSVVLDVLPAVLTLEVVVPGEDGIQSGKVLLQNADVETVEVFTATPGQVVTLALGEIPFGMYSLQVELYNASGATGTRIKTGEEQVTLLPGRPTTVRVESFVDTTGGLSIAVVWNLPVEFKDPNLEAAVREAIDKLWGPIMASDVADLAFLDASGRGIRFLDGIEYLTGLEILHIEWRRQDGEVHYNYISDLSELANLTNLRELYFSRNQVTDISALAGLVNLEQLSFYENEVSDISPLANLTSLKRLSFSSNHVTDISCIADLRNLEYLSFNENQVGDISALEKLTNLQQLYFYKNEVSDISALLDLTNLRQLNFSGNRVSDISALANMTKLESLSFGSNQVSSIDILKFLTSLTQLGFSGNQVSSLWPLSELKKLEFLSFSSNQVSNIWALVGLTNLKRLDFAYNEVSDISALTGLTNLQSLDFSSNRVEDISPLVANTGIGAGDTIVMKDNYLVGLEASQDIQALQDRDVVLTYEPQRDP